MNLFGLARQNCFVFVSWTRPSALPWDSRGEIHFPRTPISYSVPGFHFPRAAPLPPSAEGFALTCPPAAANSPPALRAAAESLRSAAFTSAARCIPRFFRRAAMLFYFTYPLLYEIIVDRWTFPPTRFPGDAVDLKRRFMAVSYSRATRIEVDYVSYTDTIIIPQTAGIVKSIPRKNPIIYRPAPSYPARRFSLKYGAGPPHCPLRNSGVTFCLQTP